MRCLGDEHWGGYREIEQRRFELAAEVVNLERSVLITGDHEESKFLNSKHKLHKHTFYSVAGMFCGRLVSQATKPYFPSHETSLAAAS